MIFFLSLSMLLYCLAIASLVFGFSKINSFESKGLAPKTKFTIIVPFRNEADNLPSLLDSFTQLKYPTELFEIILVDDDSDDKFQISKYPLPITIINNIRISASPKKDAITTAMQIVKTSWVVTTDADCLVPVNWLLTLDNYIQLHDVSMVVGAVTYQCNPSFIHHFQQLDLASLQGATIGSFGLQKGFLCNGANFAYKKTLFKELNGFEGNDTMASGDDVFLLQKAVALFPGKVHYLKAKNSIITTKPLNDWKALFYQRVRWASKTTSYQSTFGKKLGTVVFIGNINWIVLVGGGIFGLITVPTVVILALLKVGVDALLIFKSNAFITTHNVRYLILSSLWYPFFSTVVALYSLFGKYEWKGRRF